MVPNKFVFAWTVAKTYKFSFPKYYILPSMKFNLHDLKGYALISFFLVYALLLAKAKKPKSFPVSARVTFKPPRQWFFFKVKFF